MITLFELLEDPTYKAFFTTKPVLPKAAYLGAPPWRLWAQMKDGSWRKRDFAKYAEAFNTFKKVSKQGRLRDAAINCRCVAIDPPMRVARIKGQFFTNAKGEKVQKTKEVIWQPNLADQADDHSWCPYCRRPTVFKFFTRHHAFGTNAANMPAGFVLDPSTPRCVICGVSVRMTKLEVRR